MVTPTVAKLDLPPQLETILGAIADAVIVTAADGSPIYISHAVARALGYESVESLLAADSDEVTSRFFVLDEDGISISPEDTPERIVRDGRAREAQQIMWFSSELAGVSAWLLNRAKGIYDEQGELEMVVSTAEDVTVQKDSERRQSNVAETLQTALLPPSLPTIEGLELHALYTPMNGLEVGGDFYDVFEMGDGHGLLVGDVCGKGAQAAALTALCRYTTRALARHENSPAAVIHELDQIARTQHTDGRFVTVALGRIETTAEHARITLALGGHPQPLIQRAHGKVEAVGRPGMLVGVIDTGVPIAEDVTVELAQGESIVFFSDGVMDARDADGNRFPLTEFLERHRGLSTKELAQAITHAAVEHQGGSRFDDMVVLVARVPSAPVFRRRFDADAAALAAMREQFDVVTDELPTVDLEAVKLMSTELAANAIRHGTQDGRDGWFEIVVFADENRVRVQVISPGAPFVPPVRHGASIDQSSGRGFLLVDSLSARWGVDGKEEDGCQLTSVWFEQEAAPLASSR